MSKESFESIESLVFAMLDSELNAAQQSELEQLLRESPDHVARYHELLDDHVALTAIYPGDVYGDPSTEEWNIGKDVINHSKTTSILSRVVLLSTAAALLIAVGLIGYVLGSVEEPKLAGVNSSSEDTAVGRDTNETAGISERAMQGHAMLRRSMELVWGKATPSYRDGEVIRDGLIEIRSGVAEIDFFCGATITIEGPASFDIQSDWLFKLNEGRLRANVPPAARGFVIQTDEGDVIDLGTEFALNVTGDNARVEVIDGEIELRGSSNDGVYTADGNAIWLGAESDQPDMQSIQSLGEIDRWRSDAEQTRLSDWRLFADQLRSDKRLIAFYPIYGSEDPEVAHSRSVQNYAVSGEPRDATLVGPVERVIGRFGQVNGGLEFDRVGSRLRTRIDGAFEAFTFATWARIDSLDQVYNALFMSDGYETGELHWQIREDGSLMFSVMVDSSVPRPHFSVRDNAIVEDAGKHHVYFTEPVWNIRNSGQWMHFAAVYDPA
ncbi:MAG: FecR domain-containing protein, partial [Planctomycetota bacterium]